jgi:hypothetical protein
MDATAHAIEQVHRSESRRVMATLIRVPGDFALAENALQEAFVEDPAARVGNIEIRPTRELRPLSVQRVEVPL